MPAKPPLKTPLFLLLLLSFFTACTNSEETENGFSTSVNEEGVTVVSNPEYGRLQDVPGAVTMEKISEWTFPEDGPLIGNILYLNSDDEGNIYFIDRSQSVIYSYDAEGNFRWQSGQEGRGPGDLYRPFGMEVHDKIIYVNNIQGTRLDLFDLNGEFIKSRNFEEVSFARLFGFTDSGQLAYLKSIYGSLGNEVLLVENTDSMNVSSTIAYDQTGDLNVPQGMNAGPNATIHENKIVFGSSIDYSITKFDEQGNKTHIIERDFDKIVRPGFAEEGESATMINFGGVSAPLILEDGYYLTPVIWPENKIDPDEEARRSLAGTRGDTEFRYSLDLFSPAGELLYTFESEERYAGFGNPAYADNDGYLYFTKSDPEMRIEKYKIAITNN